MSAGGQGATTHRSKGFSTLVHILFDVVLIVSCRFRDLYNSLFCIKRSDRLVKACKGKTINQYIYIYTYRSEGVVAERRMHVSPSVRAAGRPAGENTKQVMLRNASPL